MDVGSSQSVNKALSAAIDSYKRPPSVIVNSAGITRDGFLLKMSEDDFDSVINVNLKVSKNIIKAEVQVGVGWDGQGFHYITDEIIMYAYQSRRARIFIFIGLWTDSGWN